MAPICVIPARGGSKGIPKKNLQLVGGQPMIVRAIHTVHASGITEAVYVSTDDSEIAGVSAEAGAEIITRPRQLAEDESPSEAALLHTLETLRVAAGELLFVQATTPLLEPADLVQLRAAHQGFDSSLTVTPSHSFVWKEGSDGSLEGVNHDPFVRHRRQDLASREYVENGAAYLFAIEGFLKTRHRFFGRIGFVTMPRLRSIEVDSLDDLQLVNHIHAAIYPRNNTSG